MKIQDSDEDIGDLLKPKPASHYADLTQGGEYRVTLTREEACVVLKIHDDGVDSLSEDEKTILLPDDRRAQRSGLALV